MHSNSKKKIVISGSSQQSINERKNRAHLMNAAEGSQVESGGRPGTVDPSKQQREPASTGSLQPQVNQESVQ